jgi:hypothetical protein
MVFRASLTAHFDVASVFRHDTLCDPESQTSAAFSLGREERAEDFRHIVLENPTAVIAYHQSRALAGIFQLGILDSHLDVTADRNSINGVVDQVRRLVLAGG